MDRDKIITKLKQNLGDKYDYSLITNSLIYNGIKIKIICPNHGLFEKNIIDAIYKKSGCGKCSGNSKSTLEEVITKFKNKHGGIYDYSKIVYVNNRTKICILCPKHGEFYQTPNDHLYYGCSKCCGNDKKDMYYFLSEAKEIHDNLYDYNNFKLINWKIKSEIKCNKCGLIFYQTPNSHINQQHGCPSCNKLSKGENKIQILLLKENIKFIKNKTFKKCFNKHKLQFDFYLPKYNICIEFNGIQHYEPIEFFGGDIKYQNQIKNDNIKTLFCKDNNIRLIKISYKEYSKIENIIKTISNGKSYNFK